MSFSFVHKISHIDPGHHARGSLRLSSEEGPTSPSLVTEAVGQLAAWAAMAAVDFERRPVAGIAGEVTLPGDALYGPILDLEVDIRRLTLDAVAYDGRAMLAGKPVLELRHCLGPMIPTTELDDPNDLRSRFTRLRSSGEPDQLVSRWPVAKPDSLPGEGGSELRRNRLTVPAEAGFYADHFPRRPIYPGTLLLDVALGLANDLAEDMVGASITCMRSVKFRRFIPPGSIVTLETRVWKRDAERVEIRFEAADGKQRVATARLEAGPAA